MFRLEKKILSRAAPPPPVKGKNFDTRFGLIKGRPTPPSKGKNFWHQIWLDTCSDRKNFCQGLPCPPLPPSKGKNFWHQIWLDTCSDWKKIFVKGRAPPPVKGKNFDTRFGLIHVQTGKKIFVEGPPPRIARNCYGYAAGGMPLAFTQEDFLVSNILMPSQWLISRNKPRMERNLRSETRMKPCKIDPIDAVFNRQRMKEKSLADKGIFFTMFY